MVRYALLGLLREERDYGYRLKRRFDDRVGALWHLNIGQVYQTLRSLQRSGLVVEVDGEETNEPYPGRRMFELTPKGQRVLERWLVRPPVRPRPVRDETLIRLLVLEPERREQAVARVVEQEHLYRRELTRLQAQKRKLQQADGTANLVGHFGVEAALLHTDAHLRWLEYCREYLERARAASTVAEPDIDVEPPILAAAPAHYEVAGA
ncbi:MAG TPA: PadR family transcriptional regulator [Candidatus Binatia bacterium]|jgi:DNA-binding PadR family transcriptional regulator|nr:PadR family transcriptional regulator [Candidatus Binatia bacterium]